MVCPFRIVRQEDAQEFLSFVMHQMHDELLKLDGLVSNGDGLNTSLVSSVEEDNDDDHWETVGLKNKTAITRTQSFVPSKLSAIFGGQLRSVVKARGWLCSCYYKGFCSFFFSLHDAKYTSLDTFLFPIPCDFLCYSKMLFWDHFVESSFLLKRIWLSSAPWLEWRVLPLLKGSDCHP